MPISSDDLFVFAKENNIINHEINSRAVVSSGYYGMYHKALSVLSFYNEPKRDCHRALINYLKNPELHYQESHDTKKLKQLSYLLEQERKNRVIADYDLKDKRFTKVFTKFTLKSHEKYLKLIESI